MKGEKQLNSMAAAREPETLSQVTGETLTRSRSRYKGSRPKASPTPVPKLPSLSREQGSIAQAEAVSTSCPRNLPDTRPRLDTRTGSNKGYVGRTMTSVTSKVCDERYNRDGQQRDPSNANNKSTISGSRQKGLALDRDLTEHQTDKRSITDQLESTDPQDFEESAAARRPQVLPKKFFTQRIAGQPARQDYSGSKEELKRATSAPVSIAPSQHTVAPAFDAPISAVNAGERRVTVKYGQTVVSVPVTPSTTPVDIIRHVAEQTSEPINPRATVLIESFRELGLERPLRRYEHVRDTLNSWISDTQHHLIIIPSPTDGRDSDLELKHVSSTQPRDTSVQIYHSQKPGVWDKRWVTLRADGQVLVAKRNGGETSNICHLSDFDIYVPTTRQIAKKIKPPRKICFAVKSQQKSSMFMSTVNFVHFFSTSDKALGTAWYKAVQEWRSWYLVNVMGEGTGAPHTTVDQHPPGLGKSSDGAPRESRGISTDPGKRVTASRATVGILPRTMTVHSQATSPMHPSRKLIKDPAAGAPTTRDHGPSIIQTHMHSGPEPFVTTGLLGRTYTQRQKAQPSSVHRGGTDHPPPIPVIKPLVDLTPKFQDPPQFSKRGRGVTPKNIPSGGLVVAATSPEAAIPLPPTTTWQRPGTSGGNNVAPDLHRARSLRKDTSGIPASEARPASASPNKGTLAFTGGLLAGNVRGQGGTGTGKGVMTGDREAKAPMLDIAADSKYVPGSLLERVEKHKGASGPIIEREKRREVNAPVGEGF
ncbi:hypothetical protein P7C71_g1010, partial [Lecanoromycetidae sp. Uapishka_2]